AAKPAPVEAKARPAPPKSKAPLYAGIAVAAALALAAVVFFVKRPVASEEESSTGILPVPSAEKTDDKEPTSLAEKPVDSPAEPIGKTPMPPDKTDDQEPTPVAAKPDD